MIHIHSFTFNALQENTYLLWDDSKECIIVDPGCHSNAERNTITNFITNQKLQPTYIYNTHCHIDHVMGASFVKRHYNIKLGIHKIEESVLRAVKTYAPNYGIYNYEEVEGDFFFEDGDLLKIGGSTIEVLFVPGHSPGHVAFYDKQQKICLSGDVLFFNSIGRTDLPGGNHNTLLDSIKSKLFTLPDDVKIYPGHGPLTTIGQEKLTNPYLKNL